jgi:hypothetical protein
LPACALSMSLCLTIACALGGCPPGSSPKTGVMSGLATILPELQRLGESRLETCIGLNATVEVGLLSTPDGHSPELFFEMSSSVCLPKETHGMRADRTL